MRTHVARVRMIAVLIFGFHISGTVVFADPLEDGQAAYNRGDYTTALKLLRPLAEQGNANAQNNIGWMYDQGHCNSGLQRSDEMVSVSGRTRVP